MSELGLDNVEAQDVKKMTQGLGLGAAGRGQTGDRWRQSCRAWANLRGGRVQGLPHMDQGGAAGVNFCQILLLLSQSRSHALHAA